MKLGLLCHLNWILIFRISFHLFKTQLQKCFIKPCFKKYHMFDLSLKYIFSQNYTPHIKKKYLFLLQWFHLWCSTDTRYHVIYSHSSRMFSLPWVHPLLFFHRLCQSPSMPCWMMHRPEEICASFGCTQQISHCPFPLCPPVLRDLLAPLLALLHTTHPPTEIKICSTLALGGSPMSWRPQTSISYHNPAHLSPNSRVGWWLCRWQIVHLIMGF